jgi:hypothetical protein
VKHLLSLLFISLVIGLNAQTNNNLELVDQRALNHYTESEIMAMDAVTIAQLNFIFRDSYAINTMKPCPISICPELDLSNFDVYDYQRELKTKKRVYLTNPGHPIDLLSTVELDIELDRIKNEILSTPQQH